MKALAPLAVAFGLLSANAVWAACPLDATQSCVTAEGCEGEMTCNGRTWSSCVAIDSCGATPLTVDMWSEGVANGRFDITASQFTSERQVYFMKDTTFTVRAKTYASVGVKQVRLQGTLSVQCEEPALASIDKTGMSISNAGSTQSNLYAANIPGTSAPELSTSISFNLSTVSCGSSVLDRVVVRIWADAKDANGVTAWTQPVEFIYVETPRFITYNIHEGRQADEIGGAYDLDGTAAHILRHRPDVVMLQDVRRHWDSKSNFDDEVPLLQQKLKMPYVYYRSAQQEGPPLWCYGVNPFDPICSYSERYSGQLLLSKFPITNAYGHVFYHRDFADTHFGWQEPGAIEAYLDTGGPTLLVGDTHYPIYCTSDAVPAPECQLSASWQLRGVFYDRGFPTILGGDFNSYREDYQMAPIETSPLDEVSELIEYHHSIDNIFFWNTGTGARFEPVSAYFAETPPGVTKPSDHDMKVARVRVINYP